MFSQTSRIPLHDKHGFALILSLVLMGFLLLLTLSLSSLVSVESQLDSQIINQERARKNALLALNVAIGQLQAHAGPDRRITGTGALLDTDPATGVAEGVNESYWTGVWDSNGTLLTWLVSGNEGLTPGDSDFFTPQSTLADPQQIYPDGSVRVPLQEVADGAYAYWISDEGVKAKITLSDDNENSVGLLSAQMVDITRMTNLDWLAGAVGQQESRLHMFEPKSLKMLAPSSVTAASVDALRHDLTASSYGLLTNTASGGLKQDLTLALYDGNARPVGQVFTAIGGSSTALDPGGPQWQQLQSWVQSAGAGELAVRPQTDEQTGVYPVITIVQYYAVPRYGSDADRTIYLDIQPVVTLWNPYDRPLEATSYRIDFGRAHVERAYDGSDWLRNFDAVFSYWQLQVNATAAINLFANGTSEADAPLSFTIANCRLEAGEAKTFSPQGNNPLDVFASYTYAQTGENQLYEGYRPSSSFYTPTVHQLGPLGEGELIATDTFQLRPYIAFSNGARLMKLHPSGGPQMLMNVLFLAGSDTPVAGTAIEPNHDPATGSITAVDSSWPGAAGSKAVRNFTEAGGDPAVKWVSLANPRSRTQGSVPFYNYGKNTTSNVAPLRITNPSFYSILDVGATDKDANLAPGGIAAGIGLNNNPYDVLRCVLFESPMPRDRLFGIGQLMQAPLFFSNVATNAALRNQTTAIIRHGAFDNLVPAYAIGNSEADPSIGLDAIYVDWTDDHLSTDLQRYARITGRHYDYSMLLNKALWDEYFFSTLPAATSREPANPRLIARDPYKTTELGSKNVAAEFLVNGAFNVNSTSEEAWRALLGAFFGEGALPSGPASPFVRIQDNSGGSFDPTSHDAGSDEAYHGYRALTQDQIVNLAHQIVKQVKWRRLGRNSPFTSMADFVNRDPYRDAPAALGKDAFRLRGALSAAIRAADAISNSDAEKLGIDAGKARINIALQEGATETNTSGVLSYFSEEALQGWRSEGIPGWLTQADLLARLGPVLSVRSDTFKIRVFGESRNSATGQQNGIAWGEAIVQRLPEFVDDTADMADADINNLNSPANQLLGRRFVIISFRWLDEDA